MEVKDDVELGGGRGGGGGGGKGTSVSVAGVEGGSWREWVEVSDGGADLGMGMGVGAGAGGAPGREGSAGVIGKLQLLKDQLAAIEETARAVEGDFKISNKVSMYMYIHVCWQRIMSHRIGKTPKIYIHVHTLSNYSSNNCHF